MPTIVARRPRPASERHALARGDLRREQRLGHRAVDHRHALRGADRRARRAGGRAPAECPWRRSSPASRRSDPPNGASSGFASRPALGCGGRTRPRPRPAATWSPRRRRHAWQRADTRRDVVVEAHGRGDLLRRLAGVEPRAAGPEPHREHAGRIEPWLHGQQPVTLRTSTPDPASSTAAIATFPATSHDRARHVDARRRATAGAAQARRPPRAAAVCRSGASPKSTPLATASATRGRHGAAVDGERRPGGAVPLGRDTAMSRTIAHAGTRPTSAPTPDSSTDSVSNWRTSRPRVTPSAARTATSLDRSLARSSSRLATFAHATSSSSATPPHEQQQRRTHGPEQHVRQASDTRAPASCSRVGCSRSMSREERR